VSTQWEKVRAFFADLAEKARPQGGFLAILEVCGMNPWLLDMLKQFGYREMVVIQPTERAKQKTDRRDAGDLAHLLWVHRQQFLDGTHNLGAQNGTGLIICSATAPRTSTTSLVERSP